jgi:hypothetical protein
MASEAHRSSKAGCSSSLACGQTVSMLSFSLLHIQDIQSNHQLLAPSCRLLAAASPAAPATAAPPRPDGPPAAALATLPPRHFILSSVCLSLRYLVAAERHPHSESALTAAADPFACSFKCQVTTFSLERTKESQFNYFSSRVSIVQLLSWFHAIHALAAHSEDAEVRSCVTSGKRPQTNLRAALFNSWFCIRLPFCIQCALL